jgi:predicted Zn-dependent protease
VERGARAGGVLDLAGAARRGVASTGHARFDADGGDALAENLVVRAGAHTVGDLLRGVRNGILVRGLEAPAILDPTSLDAVAVTRDGTFLVRGGEIGPAVRSLRLRVRFDAALARVVGVGTDCQHVPVGDRGVVAPAIALAEVDAAGIAPRSDG